MRDELHEGEWLMALDKGIRMIVSSREKKSSVKMEKIVINYFRNLVKMTPFDSHTTMRQIDISLEAIGMWMSINSRLETSHSTGRRFGREK